MTDLSTTVRELVIRFPQVDPAGIVFYPRYFEMVSRCFPEKRLFDPPTGVKTQFLKPNRFGDRIELELAGNENWSLTGSINGVSYFSMTSFEAGDAPNSGAAAFRSASDVVGDWCAGSDGRMQLSRYFELLNMAIEEWFEETLGMPFAELHVGRKVGIPTVQFDTRVFALPVAGQGFSIHVQPQKLGSRSLTFTSWLVVGDRCLVENRQVVVFVRMLAEGYESMEIPTDIRSAFGAQLKNGETH